MVGRPARGAIVKRKRTPPKEIFYNDANDPQRMHGYINVRWVENVSCGLRLVGFADEIARSIDHKGWFLRDDGIDGEVYRGVVYQLPTRHRLGMFVYGYADPNNDDCALLCFADPSMDKMEAARRADRFAEIMAEGERDYNRAWYAGNRFNELAEEIASMRKEALAIGAGMRADLDMDAACERVCRDKIRALYRQIQQARKERRELESSYGCEPGFKDA
jgi:hypothetical protein